MHTSSILKRASATAALALAALTLTACTTTTQTGGAVKTDPAAARTDIERGAYNTLERLYTEVKGSRELVRKANGVLVFPNVLAAGLVVGGEYGRGVLRTGGQSVNYYSLASLSVGFQAGAQSKAIVVLFMSKDALDKFRNSKGWTAGVDGSVAVINVGANGEIATNTVNNPVQALVLTNAGLMANLSLEGTKITRLDL
ncbi:twin-arginine translocation pathway signal [Duganella sp. Leaf126]|uniref:BPSL1445 family SYLF domain-containing lipoprotein n=1 Tax=Duganella sp. Leaf126 TaxID=1736266 RepID=UPI0006FD71FA|nr:YSC84-related protein [Duganella sp. Leaf126]KQQ39929.1 twin-arginine translocation pathway signal [Duganella sp. Leaf126]